MTPDDILIVWEKDAKIDQTEIGNELERTYQLHAKYLSYLHKEKLKKKGYEYEYKRMRLEAFEDYTQGPSKSLFVSHQQLEEFSSRTQKTSTLMQINPCKSYQQRSTCVTQT